MRTMLRSKVTLLFMALGLLIAVPAVALAQDAGDPTGVPSPAPPAPTIQSDKEDYPPADTVILTGSGWQPGETVNINVNDDDGQTWSRNVDVIADENGGVRDEFVLPDWFVATYSVTATGSSGTTATSTFTDAVLPARGCPAGRPIVVDTTEDQFDNPNATNECSLREAINAANGDPNTADTITLPQGTYTLTRTGSGEDNNQTGDLDITRQLTINGGGARDTFIQAGTTPRTIDGDGSTTPGNGIDRVLHVTSNGILSMNGATVRYGRIDDDGGGIKTNRRVTLTDVAITENEATTGKSGGGISHQGDVLILNRVLINGNTASLDGGGLHSTLGTDLLTNVTITDNSATGTGGGMRTAGASGTLTHVTVSHNSAPNGSNISRNSTIGNPNISLRSTIVSDGIGGENCSGTMISSGNNLDSGTSCGFGTVNSNKSSANANLGKLADNGGPTNTLALGAQSAAIDAGTGAGSFACVDVDQRNLPRPKDGDGNGTTVCDIGAYELQATNTAPVANDDAATTDEDIATAIDVKDNDTDADGNILSVVAGSLSDPANGTVALITSGADAGKVRYTPDPNYNNTGGANADTFTYKVRDDTAESNLATVRVTVNPVADSQTITFGALVDKTFGDAPFTVSATATSGLDVSFSASGNCTVSGNTVTITGAGSCTITASQGGNADYAPAQDVSQTFSIEKATATLSLVEDDLSQVYDGNPKTVGVNTTPDVPDKQITVKYYSDQQHQNEVQNPTNAGTYYVVASMGEHANYQADPVDSTLVIEKANAVIDVQGYEGTYDGNAHGASGTATGVGGADLSNLLDLGDKFTDVPGGTANWTFAGNDNYNPDSGSVAIVINKASSTTEVTCTSGPFTYNGSAHEPCSAKVAGPGGLNLTPDVVYDHNINAGTATASYTYDESVNYKGSSDTKTFTIGKKELLVNAKDQSTVYGEENLPPTYELSGFVNNEDKDSAGISGARECSISASAGPNVGEYTDAIACAPGTLSAANYSFAAGSKGKLSITKRPITVTADSDTKVYDGTTSSSKSPTVTGGIVNGDQANFSQAFDNKNVGQNKTLIPSGSVNDGNGGNNYQLNFADNTNGEITAKELTGSFTAANKEYDATTSANVTPNALSGVLDSDTVSLDVTNAQFDNKNVGNDKDVTGDLSLTGADAGNYTINASHTAKANITAKALTISGLSAQNKVYDGNTNATITGTLQLQGVISPDNVSISGTASGTFANASIGNNKQVTVSGLSLAGGDAGNYSLTPLVLSADISAWTFKGFYQPVDMNNTLNTVKGGSTVPIKFELFAGTTELTDTAKVNQPLQATKVTCATGATEDTIELTATGGTSLRYDSTGGQYIYNWKTPTSAGSCYKVTISANDGSSQTALFKLK